MNSARPGTAGSDSGEPLRTGRDKPTNEPRTDTHESDKLPSGTPVRTKSPTAELNEVIDNTVPSPESRPQSKPVRSAAPTNRDRDDDAEDKHAPRTRGGAGGRNEREREPESRPTARERASDRSDRGERDGEPRRRVGGGYDDEAGPRRVAGTKVEIKPSGGATSMPTEASEDRYGVAGTYDPNPSAPGDASLGSPLTAAAARVRTGGMGPASLDLSDMMTFLTTPTPKSVGIVQCYIERDKAGLGKKMYPVYQLYLKEGDRFLLAGKKRPKQKTSNYLISRSAEDLNRDSDSFVGKLRSNFVGTGACCCADLWCSQLPGCSVFGWFSRVHDLRQRHQPG
jgi:hypothetical protein